LFIVASLALGILISTLAKSQFQAMQMAFFVFLPQILLSGFIFPFAGMPKAAQWLAEILPMTHFVRLIRAIMVRGADLTEMPRDMLALAAIAAVLLILSTRRISKRLD
jgi:ABC-2 type transport system permease protein